MDDLQLKRLQWLATANTGSIFPDCLFTINNWGPEVADAAQAALDAIPTWNPMADAIPLIPGYKPDKYNDHWPCLLQNDRGEVSEGWAYWVPPRAKQPAPILRWATRLGWCTNPKYWMPLPAAKKE